jgi:hypothetical protein
MFVKLVSSATYRLGPAKQTFGLRAYNRHPGLGMGFTTTWVNTVIFTNNNLQTNIGLRAYNRHPGLGMGFITKWVNTIIFTTTFYNKLLGFGPTTGIPGMGWVLQIRG